MICPNCKSENNDGAKFCKKCGTPLKEKTVSHGDMINSMSNEKSTDSTKLIIIALIIIVVVLAGVFIYFQTAGNSNSNNQPQQADAGQSSSSVAQSNNNNEPVQATPTETKTATSSSSSSLNIQGGSFYTGSAEDDKTYARIYVGKDHAGEDVTVQIWYSRDGNTLNHGNMVPASVHSDGYLEISSADAYHYYPDHATINVYDSSGSRLLDTQDVNLSPQSGTQTF